MAPTSRAITENGRPSRPVAPAEVEATQANASDANQRWAGRRKSDTPGWLLSASLPKPVRCCVRDMSSSGALVQLHRDEQQLTVDEIPGRFVLAIGSSREYSEVQCAVVRRQGDCVGVRYIGHFKTVVKQTRIAARMPSRNR